MVSEQVQGSLRRIWAAVIGCNPSDISYVEVVDGGNHRVQMKARIETVAITVTVLA